MSSPANDMYTKKVQLNNNYQFVIIIRLADLISAELYKKFKHNIEKLGQTDLITSF